MNAHETKVMKLTQKFTEEIAELLMRGEDTCANANIALCSINSVLLPVAATTGGLNDQRDLNLKQRMVVMGNQAVCHSIEMLQETGKLKLLEMFDNVGSES